MTHKPTPIFDTYWRFAARRHDVYLKRVLGDRHEETPDPLIDPVLSNNRFTNAFRVADRVSQYLIREVIHKGEHLSPADQIARIVLFKIFNKIETWEAIREAVGDGWITSVKQIYIDAKLHMLHKSGKTMYSAAYMMTQPDYGKSSKWMNHFEMWLEVCRRAPRIAEKKSLKEVYEELLEIKGLGPFLAFQYAIDINYSSIFQFDENDFVVAGPGALGGISKCFGIDEKQARKDAAKIIRWVVETQDEHLERLGLRSIRLFG